MAPYHLVAPFIFYYSASRGRVYKMELVFNHGDAKRTK